MTLNDLEWLAKFLILISKLCWCCLRPQMKWYICQSTINSTVTLAEACSVSKRLANTSFRRQLLGKLLPCRDWTDKSATRISLQTSLWPTHTCRRPDQTFTATRVSDPGRRQSWSGRPSGIWALTINGQCTNHCIARWWSVAVRF